MCFVCVNLSDPVEVFVRHINVWENTQAPQALPQLLEAQQPLAVHVKHLSSHKQSGPFLLPSRLGGEASKYQQSKHSSWLL